MKRVKLPPVPRGHVRTYCRCKQKNCGRVYYRDFVPYSLGGRFLDVPCGHSIGHRDWNLKDITEAEFHRLRIKELRAAARESVSEKLCAEDATAR